MKRIKIFTAIFIAFFVLMSSNGFCFNFKKAQDYAEKWGQKDNNGDGQLDYLDYNPAYHEYSPCAGGDCANFYSQCLIAAAGGNANVLKQFEEFFGSDIYIDDLGCAPRAQDWSVILPKILNLKEDSIVSITDTA
jgi:hypothetical protein